MSCDELIMYMDAPYDDNTDIPWLNSFQIRTKSKMTKKQKTIEFQDNNLVVRNRHTLNCAPCYVDLTNINERQTRNLLKRRNTIDCSKTFKAQFNDVNENIQSFSVHGKPKRKCRRNPIYYCWECHLIIKIKTQYCCLSCSRLYHKICFTFNDLVCLDCYMSKRMKNQDPESLALTLGATMDKVLKSESASTLSCLQSYYLGKNKLINLKSISQKVDSKTYTCFFDFLSDIKMILHKCCIKPS